MSKCFVWPIQYCLPLYPHSPLQAILNKDETNYILSRYFVSSYNLSFIWLGLIHLKLFSLGFFSNFFRFSIFIKMMKILRIFTVLSLAFCSSSARDLKSSDTLVLTHVVSSGMKILFLSSN